MNKKKDYIKLYELRIKELYEVDDITARTYAIKAIDAYESHGGCKEDKTGMESVILVVVKSWLNRYKDE